MAVWSARFIFPWTADGRPIGARPAMAAFPRAWIGHSLATCAGFLRFGQRRTCFVENGMTSFGFVDELMLPIVVTPRKDGRDVDLNGFLQIGVCKEICVPYALDVAGTLDASQTKVVAPIAAAMAEQPYSATEGQVRDISCRIAPTNDGMAIKATINMPSAGGREFAVIETGNPELWVQEAKVSREGRTLTVASDVLHVEGAPFFLQRSLITITVLGSDYAVEINGCQAG